MSILHPTSTDPKTGDKPGIAYTLVICEADVAREAEAFYWALDRRRRALGLTWRQVAADCGVDPNVLTRLGRQETIMSDSLFSLSAWLKRTQSKPPGWRKRKLRQFHGLEFVPTAAASSGVV